MSDSQEPETVQGHLRVFGYDDTPLELTVIPRTTRWRALRAGVWVGAAVILAPLVVLPPHVLWALLALVGLVLGIRKWAERYTLVELTGRCPKCGSEIAETGPGRFRPGRSVTCPSCRLESSVVLPERALQG